MTKTLIFMPWAVRSNANERQAREEMIDKALERKMDAVLKIVVLGRAARNAANIKNRQPLRRMYVKSETLPEFYQTIILDELNLKEVEFVSDVQDFTSYTFKPQLKTVGPKYGKQLGRIKTALSELDGNKAMNRLNEQCFFHSSLTVRVWYLQKMIY